MPLTKAMVSTIAETTAHLATRTDWKHTRKVLRQQMISMENRMTIGPDSL